MKNLKIAAQVWILALLTECACYAVILHWEMGLVVLPFACLGGLPALLLFWFFLDQILPLFDSLKSKYFALFAAALFVANLDLTLFVAIINCWEQAFMVYSVLNFSTLLALAMTLPSINKKLFVVQTPIIDLELDTQPFQFKKNDSEL